jgi:hypothetical protein
MVPYPLKNGSIPNLIFHRDTPSCWRRRMGWNMWSAFNGQSSLPATLIALFLHLYQENTNQGSSSGMVPYPLQNNSTPNLISPWYAVL